MEIRQEDSRIVIVPTIKRDPILALGEAPVACGATDASVQHDMYLYGSRS